MFEVIGIIAVTLALGYVFFYFFVMGLFPMIGFDEFDIPVGLLCWTLAAGVAVAWWFLVGTHISLGFSYG